ncbi:uncharacterized protein LOC143025641 [Oratosquilla oratoria]|uniref:uncharacterized protein LOC143025641 n=1 Tax=Oratosquilla oratoria TaxID=337810 RepID=UPI003F776281
MVSLTKLMARPIPRVRSAETTRTMALARSTRPVLPIRVSRSRRRTPETESALRWILPESSRGLTVSESPARRMHSGTSRGASLPSSSTPGRIQTAPTRDESPLLSLRENSSTSSTSSNLIVSSATDTSTVPSRPEQQSLISESSKEKRRTSLSADPRHGVTKRRKLDEEEGHVAPLEGHLAPLEGHLASLGGHIASLGRNASSSSDSLRASSSSKGLRRSLSYPGDASQLKSSSRHPGPYL